MQYGINQIAHKTHFEQVSLIQWINRRINFYGGCFQRIFFHGDQIDKEDKCVNLIRKNAIKLPDCLFLSDFRCFSIASLDSNKDFCKIERQ